MEKENRQIIAFHIGQRTIKDAKKLWKNIPKIYKNLGYFHTDFLSAYKHIFNKEQHSSCGKETGETSFIKRFNCTLRQRCSRLIRNSLSFSKKLTNHIEAIRYFIRAYNKERIILLY